MKSDLMGFVLKILKEAEVLNLPRAPQSQRLTGHKKCASFHLSNSTGSLSKHFDSALLSRLNLAHCNFSSSLNLQSVRSLNLVQTCSQMNTDTKSEISWTSMSEKSRASERVSRRASKGISEKVLEVSETESRS